MADLSDRRAAGAGAPLERLAFSFHGSVPAPRVPAPEPTFATVPHSEPRDWGYTGLVAFTAVLLLRPQDTIRALEPLHLAEICALLGIAPMLLHRLVHRLPMFRVTAETVGLMFLAGVMLATVPFSIWPGGALNEFLETFVKVLIVFVLMLNTLTSVRRIEQVAWLIVLCTGYIALRGVIDYARGMNLVEGGRLAGAVGGIFGNPNDLALNMVSILPLAVVFAMSKRHGTGWRMAAAAIALLMIATVIFTKSRAGTLGLVVVLVALLSLSRLVKPPVLIGALAASLLILPALPGSFWMRMATIFDSEQDAQQFTGSREARERLLTDGWNAFMDHPLTGVGAGQFVNYNPPDRQERWRETHNVLLQVAADLGLFGLAAFVFLISRGIATGLLLRRRLGPARRRHRAPPLDARALAPDERQMLHELAIALTAALIGWFTCALFASVAYAWTFYYLLALLVASRELVRDRVARVAAEAPPEGDAGRRAGIPPRVEPLPA